MQGRITKTGSNVLPWKIVASTRSNGRQRWEIDVSSWWKKLAATCFLGSSWLYFTRKKIGSNVFPWKFVGSLLVDNFLNNILEFPEKANSTINVVSERWKTCHLQLLELNQIYTWSSTSIKLQKLNFSLHSWRTQQTCFSFFVFGKTIFQYLSTEYKP